MKYINGLFAMAFGSRSAGKAYNSSDPWRGGGGKKDNEGPPELDELLKKLQDKINGFFGGGNVRWGSSGGGAAGNNNSLFLIIFIAILFIAFTVYKGLYRVEEAEKALILKFGKYHTIVGAGLHWNLPIVYQVLKLNTEKIRIHSHKASMLTEDQNIVDIEIGVQYKVSDPRNFFLKINDGIFTLKQATESALRHVVGGTEMDMVLTEGRYLVGDQVTERLEKYLSEYNTGIEVIKVNIKDAHPPNEVKAAFDDVIKAREDETRLKNEAEAYSNGVIPEARGIAQRQLEEAQAYKQEVIARAEGEASRFDQLLKEYRRLPVVLRERLYLETMEHIFKNTSKVVVDLPKGNQLMVLPMDQILKKNNSSALSGLSQSLPQLESLPSTTVDTRSRNSNRNGLGRVSDRLRARLDARSREEQR